MREHAGKLAQVQTSHERQTNSQHQIIADHSQRATTKSCRSIEITIQINPIRHGCADGVTDFCDEGKERWFEGGIGRKRLRVRRATCKQGFDHEQNQHTSDEQRGDVSNQFQ